MNLPVGRKYLMRTTCFIMLIYVTLYIVLTVNGKYTLLASGRNAIGDTGVPIRDTYVWFPLGVAYSLHEYSALGLLYFPLISFDRSMFHKNINVEDI